MTPRTGAFFFSFATVKTVDDHCGLPSSRWTTTAGCLPRLRHDAADGRLLLLLCHREDGGRPLRAAFLVSGMTPRTGNPLHAFFRNNSGYHDVHHQLNGSKYNFSQPLSVMWDRIMGTYMAYSLETRKEGRVRSPADQTQELMGPSISCF
ncbi:hypothetical protein C4D60_Mb08t18440 [Musa balbisiana]|uniref:Fatty acid hydroxylase domain-containing protein n=1 Tax=Musa balbisiana TaxID=52838 RepID=A0A4S8K4P3_MUSBA|nr:hypothetical protein C4D60_Mb08t18440 [Musa balbisiana]